jgi:DNA-nicking Smr family endonuclease
LEQTRLRLGGTRPILPSLFRVLGCSVSKSRQVCSTTRWVAERWNRKEVMAKLKLDLHDIYNRGGKIEKELNRVIQEAVEKRIKTVEIIPGKGSGQLKKKVLRFLNQSHNKKLYHRVEKDDKNFGRIFVHFRHK